jgi:flagellar biogenesis protein FliO
MPRLGCVTASAASPRWGRHSCLPVTIIALVLLTAASVAPAQTTRPVVDDPYQNMPLPPRREATTQAAAPGAVSKSGDIFDTRRLVLALAIVLGAIFVSHQVWKRMGMPGVAGRVSGALQVVSRLTIAPKQQVLLLRVGRRLVLVGNSGTQMNSLCEIADPEEAALILGQTAAEREGSLSTSFNTLLGGEEKRFEEHLHSDTTAAPAEPEPDDPSIASTREEISGLLDKVRGLSKQFGKA